MNQIEDLPGKRLREIRKAKGHTTRTLAENCTPLIDFTTVSRIELNKGYTKDTLERFATVLNCTVTDFFLDDNLKNYTNLPEDLKKDVGKYIDQLLIVAQSRA